MEREFCVYCGAGIGTHFRNGEGTCPKCDPPDADGNTRGFQGGTYTPEEISVYGPEDYINGSTVQRLRDTGYIQRGLSINHTVEFKQLVADSPVATDPLDILLLAEELDYA